MLLLFEICEALSSQLVRRKAARETNAEEPKVEQRPNKKYDLIKLTSRNAKTKKKMQLLSEVSATEPHGIAQKEILAVYSFFKSDQLS